VRTYCGSNTSYGDEGRTYKGWLLMTIVPSVPAHIQMRVENMVLSTYNKNCTKDNQVNLVNTLTVTYVQQQLLSSSF